MMDYDPPEMKEWKSNIKNYEKNREIKTKITQVY